LKAACILMLCSIVAVEALGSDSEIAAAQKEYRAIEKELIAVIRKREEGPKRKALEEAKAVAGQAFEKAALSGPDVAALEERKKGLDAKLVVLRKQRREEEARQNRSNAMLETLVQKISRVEAERREIKEQISQTIMTLPSLEAPRRKFSDVEKEIKQFTAEQTPEMKEIRERLDAARSQWHRLRVELSKSKQKRQTAEQPSQQ
jgi:chromosome segregation ATPase